jgi:predicted dehydrogenase
MSAIRWGIWGLGYIARKFAIGLQSVPDAQLYGAASREKARAEQFAKEFPMEKIYGSYKEMIDDPSIDIVYVAVPHPLHISAVFACLEAGKAVLCEKPFAMNVRESEEMIARAKACGVFLMEAMWTRMMPPALKARDLARKGAIGEPMMWRADFSSRANFNPESRLFNKALGGGALLDIGIYPLSLALFFLGELETIKACAVLGKTEVDESMAFSTKHKGGGLGSMATSWRVSMPHDAVLYGSEGALKMAGPWWGGEASLTLIHADGKEEDLTPQRIGNGYNYEAAEAGRCLRAGLLESPLMTWKETLDAMRAMDLARESVGLVYEADR